MKLSAEKAKAMDIEEIDVDEAEFRYEMNKSKMATDLLSAGIRSFEQDGDTLKEMIRKRIVELHPKKEWFMFTLLSIAFSYLKLKMT